MQSIHLESALVEFLEEAAALLRADVDAGSEVPFEVETTGSRAGGSRPALYCYRPLTADFIAERQPALQRLESHDRAIEQLLAFDGLDRYLLAAGVDTGRASRPARARMALRALLAEACADQSDFELRPERVRTAIERMESAAEADAGGMTLVATLHGLTIASEHLQLTGGLSIASPSAFDGLPDAARASSDGADEHLVAVLSSQDVEPAHAIAQGCAVMRDLLRALRLFGEGRVAMGALAWVRIGTASWSPIPLGGSGRPHGMLLVAPEQEDELRAFCNLVSRRAPADNEIAWALRRFELGCDRGDPLEALTDHLAALRALLEPEGPHSALLPGRLAALCATPEECVRLTERTLAALALERAAIAGTAARGAGNVALAAGIADHLRALLRDVICGHLEPDLVSLADEILLERVAPAPVADAPGASPMPVAAAPGPAPEPARGSRFARGSSAEQVPGDPREAEEILDLFV